MNEISTARDSAAVSAEAVIEVRMTDPAPLPLVVGLSCTSENPGAVSVSFCGDDELRAWTCAREFLAEGLTVPAEDGDMMLWREGEDTLVVVQRLPDPVRFEYPGGRIRFEFPAGEIRAFLDSAYELVPAGTAPAAPDAGELNLPSWAE